MRIKGGLSKSIDLWSLSSLIFLFLTSYWVHCQVGRGGEGAPWAGGKKKAIKSRQVTYFLMAF